MEITEWRHESVELAKNFLPYYYCGEPKKKKKKKKRKDGNYNPEGQIIIRTVGHRPVAR